MPGDIPAPLINLFSLKMEIWGGHSTRHILPNSDLLVFVFGQMLPNPVHYELLEIVMEKQPTQGVATAFVKSQGEIAIGNGSQVKDTFLGVIAMQLRHQ